MGMLGGRWRVVRVGAGSLIYRQIKSLLCSGYLLVILYNSMMEIFRFTKTVFVFATLSWPWDSTLTY